MPIFMDRHEIPGVNAKDVASAHQEDLKIQKEFNCKALTYWFDEEKGLAFCLIEAPDKESVQKLHDEAHGLIPNQIIEVEPSIVASFLGRIEDPSWQDGSGLINEPAFRTIMVVNINPVFQYGNDESISHFSSFLSGFMQYIKDELNKHHGLEVETADSYFMASFDAAGKAVGCASGIRDYIKNYNQSHTSLQIELQTGLSSGIPVSGDEEFFGATVKVAKQMSMIARPGQLLLSPMVHDQYNTQPPHADDHQPTTISVINPQEEKFLNQVAGIMEKEGCFASFDVNAFGFKTGMSKSQLYRKITSLTGYSPNDFIKEYRLKSAYRLVEKQKGNISEIAYECGFSSLSYFSKCFQGRFGISPSFYSNSFTTH